MSKKLYRAPACLLLSESSDVDGGLVEIQVLKTGNFFDPRYGKFSITRKHFSEMISNFKAGVRGIDIALDYAHQTDGISAAWFKEIYEKPVGEGFGLFAKVEPTGSGRKSLAEKEYRYISADFDPNYKDNEKGESHGCVLEGAALTNRPVIKGMQAIQLSEIEGNTEMMTIEEAMAKITALEAEIVALKKTNEPVIEHKPNGDIHMTPEESKRLSDLETENTALKAEKSDLEEKVKLSEKNNSFNTMLSEGKVVEAQRKFFVDGDMVGFAANASKIKLSEQGDARGNVGDADASESELEDEMAKEVSEMSKDGKMTLSEATKAASRMPKYKSLFVK